MRSTRCDFCAVAIDAALDFDCRVADQTLCATCRAFIPPDPKPSKPVNEWPWILAVLALLAGVCLVAMVRK